ncbi:MFS transporter [Rurimicrobium arvi]|uniref:MFS transporter n=2 Tax=Rurimicrobium arvi TaxID=2049916 RepID=A0ABP8MH37_9BACT
MLILIAALGYFVDVYDLILFIIVRQPSLTALGYTGTDLTREGILLLNLQMIGMLSGGIVWGILGDKKGRLSVLFGTILLYSLANILNGMIQNIQQYYVLRFVAGFGLAGELGAGVTLVSEVMSKEKRGLGTTIVSGIGIAGAVAGFLVADKFDWRTAYYVGGGMGLFLLLLRVSVAESGMFARIREDKVVRGGFLRFLLVRKNFVAYVRCIFIGIPIWFTIGIIVTMATELASALHISGVVKGSTAVMYHYIGASAGAFLCGILSQTLRSRKKALLIALLALAATIGVLFAATGASSSFFYWMLLIIGIPNGYWSVFMSTASEQFGTNIRATVTTTIPNFVRGTIVGVSAIFVYLSQEQSWGFVKAAMVIGSVLISTALIATMRSEDTFGKNLDFIEG